MKNIITAITIGLFTFTTQLQAHSKTTPVGADSISEEILVKHIKILASDEFGGRAPGTKGEELTVNYPTSL